MNCDQAYDWRFLCDFMANGNFDPNDGPVSVPKCTTCSGVIKPDVRLEGDRPDLEEFSDMFDADANACDLLVVVGTRLNEAPICYLATTVDKRIPRVYINNSAPDYMGAEERDLQLLVNKFKADYTFERRRDVRITKFRIDYVIGDIINQLGWQSEVDSLREIQGQTIS